MSQSLLDTVFANAIAKKCLAFYSNLSKSGKPIDTEWTVLSCFVLSHVVHGVLEVVSLGTGSKCIGASKMSPNGDVLNDSHAEVIARRGFLLYLYDNVTKALNGEPSIFVMENGLLRIIDNIEIIFYSSQLPCGDASIIPETGEEELYGEILKPQKRVANSEIAESENKKQKIEGDHRTGAKCLPQCKQDPKETGNYHLLGEVRTKPGRGDRTLSVSCTDKIAKWIHLGVQGSLLDMICKPIHIKYFIFGDGVPYSEDSLKRGLLKRKSDDTMLFLDLVPEFFQSSVEFENVRNEYNTRPAPGSIVWVKTEPQVFEVAVQGKKLGVTRSQKVLPQSSLCISKYNIYRTFLNTLDYHPELKRMLCDNSNIESIPYNVMKRKSTRYYERWHVVKNEFFKTWTVKPDMWDFSVNM